MRRGRALVASGVLLLFIHPGCANSGGSGCDASTAGISSSSGSSCWFFCTCPNPNTSPTGSVHGIDPGERVDVSASEAWPGRPPRPEVFTPQEVAGACATLVACAPQLSGRVAGNDVLSIGDCLSGSLSLFGVNAPERAIPITGVNESWQFLVREVLAANGDCSTLKGALTESVHLSCQEDGCWSTATDPPKVTCDGAVATLKSEGETWQRDCSRSNMRCSEKSETGCTDRPLVQCENGGRDRCDGDLKLGCDSCGFVSFHDCSWNGGHCEESVDGARCVDPQAECDSLLTSGCHGDSFSVCAEGERVAVGCNALGAFRCQDAPLCDPRTPTFGCLLAQVADAGSSRSAACVARPAQRDSFVPGAAPLRFTPDGGATVFRADAGTMAPDGG